MDNLSVNWENVSAERAGSRQGLMECVEILVQSCVVMVFVIDGEHLRFLDSARIWNNRSDDLRKCEPSCLKRAPGPGEDQGR